MSIISWNFHGLGNPWAQQFLKDLVVQKKPNYLFLCETLAKKDMVERVRVAIGFEGALAIDCQGKSGGVALLWKDEEDVQVLDYGVSYIDVVICGCDQGHWRLMGLYGDLNNVTSQDDKKGGHPYPRWLVEVFNDTLVDCGLHDLELYGYPYTWERSRGTADRVEREIFWKQRSKQLWLREGDSNSKYFHASTTARRRRNSIQKLKDSAGVWVNWKGRLPSVMVEYFSTLFTATAVADNEVIQCVPSAVTSEHNNRLLEPVSDDEVRHALFQMHPDKSSGHDGMTLGFYQKCWSTVLANRFKDVLPMVISNHQSVFLPGRLISDNIMVAFEIMHYLKRKRVGKEGFMAIKLNMSKAYDQVEWSFIENMLILMGFDQHWVHLIMFCVTTVSYNITHGGHSMGPITPSRGLRQGDPLSPYLFLICAKGLLLLLKHYERHHWLTGCRVARGAPMVSHMLFADDSYVFCKANENEAQNVLRLLHRYELASGQQVNFAKSSVFFSNNITVAVHDRLCGLMRLNAASDDSFYLGLPSIMGRNKNAILGFLKEKLKKKIFSWETKFLSKAGKEVLIKSVAQALPNYAMSVFLLTHEIWSSLEGMMAKFWWKSQSSSSSKGVSWVSWKKLCQHKNVGGLGFRDLRDYNLSFLGKQGWRLLTMEDTLVAKIYKARYYPHGSFLNVELGQNPSFIWRSIWAAQDLVKNGARRSIANGSSVSILHDPWLPNDSNPFVLSNNTGLVDQYVSSLMVVGERSWDVELLCKVFFWQFFILNDMFEERDINLIRSIQLSHSRAMDGWYWNMESLGFYSVKSAYKFLQSSRGNWLFMQDENCWKNLWQLPIPSKVHHFLWKACSGCLPTKVQLQSKHVNVDLLCPLCNMHVETIFHVLLDCSFSRSCWALSAVNQSTAGANAELSSWFFDLLADCSENKSQTALEVVKSAKHVLGQWKITKFETPNALFAIGDTSHNNCWRKPDVFTVKVNVDGATFKAHQKFSFGCVARNNHGKLLEAISESRWGCVSAEIAEVIGIKEALSWIKRKGWDAVVVESDALGRSGVVRKEERWISSDVYRLS
ncbi:uncharacterized protein LOC115695103 [Cannabis sativa]|uniref:uncharacterized protein LOC115695103 n=1 Tax=Cannabis sativa TaxID=3483 RepID=UPI0029CA5C1A|nr:uncharacterized protein LOC115695103 [Cannabis sativa]